MEVIDAAAALRMFVPFARDRDVTYLPFISQNRRPFPSFMYGRDHPLRSTASLVRFSGMWSVDTGVLALSVNARSHAFLMAMLRHWDGGLFSLAAYCLRAAHDESCLPSVPCGEEWMRSNLFADDLYVVTLHLLASLHGWGNPLLATTTVGWPIELRHGWLGQGRRTVGDACTRPGPGWWVTVCPNASEIVSPFDLTSIFFHHIASTGPYTATLTQPSSSPASQTEKAYLHLPETLSRSGDLDSHGKLKRLDLRLKLISDRGAKSPDKKWLAQSWAQSLVPCEFAWERKRRHMQRKKRLKADSV